MLPLLLRMKTLNSIPLSFFERGYVSVGLNGSLDGILYGGLDGGLNEADVAAVCAHGLLWDWRRSKYYLGTYTDCLDKPISFFFFSLSNLRAQL